jgi:hypothetical protein
MDNSSEITKLPCDLQECLYDHVLKLRRPRCVLTDELKEDIKTYPLMNQIKRNYAQVFSPDHASSWIENALINLLNENTELPNTTDVNNCTLDRLWIITPSSLRRELYDISCNMLVHYISHG